MPYSVEQLRKKASECRSKETLTLARLHQSRIQFHTVKRVTPYSAAYLNQPLSQFFAMAENLLPHDKFVQFKAMFRYPIKTNEITGVIFDKLSRIFDGRNASYNYQFASTEEREDWEEYRMAVLNEPQVWKTKGWEFFKMEINSVLIVDMPREQAGDRPAPYFYWLPITDVIDFKADAETGQMDYIIFRRGGRIIALDDATYRAWKEDKSQGLLNGEPEWESPHDLGYCPARFFWNKPLSLETPDVKESPLSSELESLDWFEFFHISKRQLDLYGAYPILSGYQQRCDFSNEENGDYCDGGFLRDKQGHYRIDRAGALMRCPKCGKRVVGAGSFVEIPVPSTEPGAEVPDLRNPVQMLTVDRDALDYNVDEEKRLKDEIITAVVGQNEIVTDRDAFNEQQVRANFESVTTILNRTKTGFESAQEWVESTICRLRYAGDFISVSINYGTEFYLSTPDELRQRYKDAKDAGASEAELDLLQNNIIETENRSNPEQMRRMLILAELEPMRHSTRAEVIELYKEGLASRTDVIIKTNFSSFIRRFEREQANVLTFGSEIPYESKIKTIQAELSKYASEMAPTLNSE